MSNMLLRRFEWEAAGLFIKAVFFFIIFDIILIAFRLVTGLGWNALMSLIH
jgi:hypothetical protein